MKALFALCWEVPQTSEAKAQLVGARLAEAGAIPSLVKFLASENINTREMALSVLSRLTPNVDCCRRAAAAGAIPLLVQIMENGTEEMRAMAMWTLSSIGAKVVAAGSVTPIIQLLSSPGSTPALLEMQEAAAVRLRCCYAVGSAGLRAIILAAGALPVLSNLLKVSSSEAVRREAGTALLSLEGAAASGTAGVETVTREAGKMSLGVEALICEAGNASLSSEGQAAAFSAGVFHSSGCGSSSAAPPILDSVESSESSAAACGPSSPPQHPPQPTVT